ncbi:MAG: L-glutamate gamma-semialdehyde dehydrogenase [Planctomycetota bacterium]|nr:L-glutamate gamma-semialdehyde dehydrogenase [Planctomycetota bacterium]
MRTLSDLPPFVNEAFTNFGKEPEAAAFQQALAKIESSLPVVVRLWINGQDREGGAGTFESTDPGKPTRAVANSAKGNREDALAAIVGAHKAFGSWSRLSAEERAEYFFRAARIMRLRKHEFSAMMVFEVGKNWAEADGDTAEAIDFLEFYAREALRYARRQPITPVDGEQNELIYIPIGVGAVIPPWNFPLAILVGMTSASLVTGNTVVLKPSSDAPGIASMFVDLMKEVGLPPGVLQFVPGGGADVGNTLVEHPLTRFIAFTGSAQVGCSIYEKASKVHPGQLWLKRVVAEMGGKDFIFVDEDANLDEAARGAHSAAFGFQGQKCSACSRLILHAKIKDAFMERFLPLVEATAIGHPSEKRSWLGPMIHESAMKDTLAAIEKAKQEGNTLVAGGARAGEEGWFVQPTVFTGVGRGDFIWKNELFAPVLAVHEVKSFEEGIEAANDSDFGLTGAYYGADEQRLATARRELYCGNLYLNRGCTGALVGAHPFGGFNMSGTDSKAGGRDYLMLFLQAKTISRKR